MGANNLGNVHVASPEQGQLGMSTLSRLETQVEKAEGAQPKNQTCRGCSQRKQARRRAWSGPGGREVGEIRGGVGQRQRLGSAASQNPEEDAAEA